MSVVVTLRQRSVRPSKTTPTKIGKHRKKKPPTSGHPWAHSIPLPEGASFKNHENATNVLATLSAHFQLKTNRWLWSGQGRLGSETFWHLCTTNQLEPCETRTFLSPCLWDKDLKLKIYLGKANPWDGNGSEVAGRMLQAAPLLDNIGHFVCRWES